MCPRARVSRPASRVPGLGEWNVTVVISQLMLAAHNADVEHALLLSLRWRKIEAARQRKEPTSSTQLTADAANPWAHKQLLTRPGER